MLDSCKFHSGLRCGVEPILCANCEESHVGIRVLQDEIDRIQREIRRTKDREYRSRRKNHVANETGRDLHYHSDV
jgi:hypothetical protein